MCSDPAARSELTRDVLVEWEMYSATEDLLANPSFGGRFAKEKFSERYSEPRERELWMKALHVSRLLEEHRREKFIAYPGGPLDVVAEALVALDGGEVSAEFVDDLVNRCRDALKNLDAVFYLPAVKRADGDEVVVEAEVETEAEDEAEGGADEDDKAEGEAPSRLEQVYFNIVNEYLDEGNSGIFPRTDCPGVIVIEGDDPIAEMRDIIGRNGELSDEGASPEQLKELMNAIRDPKLKSEVEKIVCGHTIPLVGGGTADIHSIEL